MRYCQNKRNHNLSTKYNNIYLKSKVLSKIMFILLVSFLAGFANVQSRQIAHNTGVESCIYTFNVPRDNDMCPPGSMEPSEVRAGGLKWTMETQHSQISEQLRNLTQMISELHGQAVGGGQDAEKENPALKSGTHYTRWGHSACPSTADLLYTGWCVKHFRTYIPQATSIHNYITKESLLSCSIIRKASLLPQVFTFMLTVFSCMLTVKTSLPLCENLV